MTKATTTNSPVAVAVALPTLQILSYMLYSYQLI